MLTDVGREQFVVYLGTLEEALKTAAKAVAQVEKTIGFFPETAPARA